MSTLLTLVSLALIAAVAGWVAAGRAHWTHRVAAAGFLGAASLAFAILLAPEPADAELHASLPIVGAAGEFGSSDACRSCHPGQYSSWHDTFHRTMTQVATPETVRAPFDGRVLEERGRGFRISEREGKFYVRSEGSGNEWRVVMLTGSHHLQAYWLKLDDHRLAQFPFVYLIEEGRWLANSDSFLQPEPGNDEGFAEAFWTEGCVNCHSTGGPWEAGEITAQFATRQAVTELGIACEACHGPAQEHIAANRDPRRRYELHRGREADPTILNPRRLDAERSASLCGRCHTLAEHREGSGGFAPGGHLAEVLDHERLWAQVEEFAAVGDPDELPEDDRDPVESFWTNGTVRVAGREYDGMVRSRCYLEDEMSCVSCHRVHGGTRDRQLDHDVTDEQMCGSCHEEEFSDVPAHTHHEAESEGSRCVGCHMPYSSYGLLMGTRSHRLDSPVASGVGTRVAPNACNLCHQDQSLGWTAERLLEWYGRESPEAPAELRDVPAGALWLLRGDAVQRALAAWHLRQSFVQDAGDMSGLEPHLLTLLQDPVSAVRQVGARTLELAHPEWELDMPAIAADAQPDRSNELRDERTGLTDRETFGRLWFERIDYPVSIPE